MSGVLSQNVVQLTASELVAAISKGELCSREVVDAHIERIEQVDTQLNAVPCRRFEEARAEAEVLDKARGAGERIGSLQGIPITIKDQYLVAGTPTTFGLPSRAAQLAEQDGPLVARLRQAGGIVLGKTNVGQMLMFHESTNLLYGQTNNPWDIGRTPGGSSGGEAAIIAAGGSPLGLGGDLGGSVRVPAHFCGIAALKPTSRRLAMVDTPSDPFFQQEVIFYQPGPMARKVSDLALAMSVLAAPGQEAFDRLVEPRPWIDAAVDVSQLRCGVYEDDGWFTPSPGVRRAVREAAGIVEGLGVRVEEFRPPDVGEALRLFLSVVGFDSLRALRRAIGDQEVVPQLKGLIASTKIPGPVRPLVAAILAATGRGHAAMAVRAAGPETTERMERLAAQVDQYRARFIASMAAAGLDFLLCPPYGLPALTHGRGDDLTVHTAGSYAALFNLLGFPAGVVPVTRVRAGEESGGRPGRDVVSRKALEVEHGSAGLPVGVQVVGRPWREDQVLAAMTAIEAQVRTTPDCPVTPCMR